MDEEYYPYIKEWFRKEARYYHILVDIPFSRMRDKIADFTNAREGSRILDAATGTGGQAFAFARKGHDVVGIDLSEEMLEVANRRNEHENLRFKVADAADLPFQDDSFDVSCISFALHDMPVPIREKAVEEMARVTKPTGSIVILDYASPENRIAKFLAYHLMKAHETKYYPEFVKSDLEALLRKSGIEIVDERSLVLGAGRLLKGVTKCG
jgi:demethylmenaquinone methyltransferase/2-methoxy-6-polyprenyl-1,4-benzoquinol methylase